MSKLRRLISFILAFSLLCPVVFVRVSAYNDTEGHWAAQAIARWTEFLFGRMHRLQAANSRP